MLVSPLEHKGYKVRTIGDDIAWLRPGPDGRLYAVNPEAGFFGVAPGTSPTTNPQMMRTIDRNTIFTNVGLLPDKTVWWEGLEPPPRADGMVDWQGRPWSPASGTKAAHPNSRFTAPIRQCPVFSPTWDDPAGVPISAILFGARRSAVAPLIYEARSWQHGVYLGATLASETTAAATGAVGVLRRDPMAMLPFCGYNMADYFGHWLELGRRLAHPPRIFRVNWFRKDAQGRDLWPGFGENIRVIRWAIERCRGRAAAVESPLGLMPTPEALGADSLPISSEGWSALLGVDRAEWLVSVPRQSEFFDRFGDRLPDALRQEQRELLERLRRAE